MGVRFRGDRPLLQVALDLISLEMALKVAEKAWEAGVDILEAGTPLIKSEGMRAVKALKREFPSATLVADLKTMDTGRLEFTIAAEAGADVATVLAVAPDSTVEEAVDAGKSLGIVVEADLIGHPDPLARASQLERLGVELICVHVGVDVQRRLGVRIGDMAGVVEAVKRAFRGKVAVAGGVNRDSAPLLARAGADIVIVGSAIVKAGDPYVAASEIIRAVEAAARG